MPAQTKKAAASVKDAASETPGYHNLIIATDFGDSVANAQIELRFRSVLQWCLAEREKRQHMPKEVKLDKLTAPHPLPHTVHVDDIPFGNTDFAAHAIYTSFRSIGRTWPNIMIHVCDPGVGKGDDRRILITDYGNAFIGPDNGSLGLIRAYFEDRGVETSLWQIDRHKIEALEQHRMAEPSYHIPRTFHGRDVFAVAAGLLAGGIAPTYYAHKLDQPVEMSPFVAGMDNLPLRLRSPQSFLAFRDNTFGNLKTNLTTDTLTFNQLMEEQATFRVTNAGARRCCGLSVPRYTFGTSNVFADQAPKQPLLYLGSTFAPEWDQRILELAVNMDDAGAYLKVPSGYSAAVELIIERLS